jgi:hypothetical protein
MLYFNLFRRNETEMDTLTSQDIVHLLNAYKHLKFSNKLILGYMALEWTRRLERLSDL